MSISLENQIRPSTMEYVIHLLVENELEFSGIEKSYKNDVASADMYFGRKEKILIQREIIKQKTLQMRKRINMKSQHHEVFA